MRLNVNSCSSYVEERYGLLMFVYTVVVLICNKFKNYIGVKWS